MFSNLASRVVFVVQSCGMITVAEISGKQYAFCENDFLVVDKLDAQEGKSIVLDKILLHDDGKTTHIGTPYLKNVKVKAKIVQQAKGEKIHVRRYKSKVRYRRATGFRPQLTKLQIESIS